MAKMKTMPKLVVILIAFLTVGGCAAIYELYNAFYNVILESKYVDHFNVAELLGTHPTKLKISGHPFYSGMVVRAVTEKKDGPTIIVSVHLAVIGLVKPKTTGMFEYEVSVPDSVNEVRFGRSSTLIWQQGSSSRHP